MDTVSHALWGKGLFGYRRYQKYAILFGSLPDLMSFGVYFFYSIVANPTNYKMGKPALNEIPNWVFSLYDISHSIIIAFIFIAIVSLLNRDLCFPMFAWPFHILLDFFTHSTEYFPTPIFWPISNYRFDGIPWSTPAVWYTNLILIVLLFVYRKRFSNNL